MGEIWREELEIAKLENVVFDLYEQIKPLYLAIHAVVRHKLYLKYGSSEVDPKGPIPIHLLGTSLRQPAHCQSFTQSTFRKYVGTGLVTSN